MASVHPHILAVCSTKGGVGKTTVCCGVASALEQLGRRVLVVDVDPNGDTSTALGIDPMSAEVRPGAFELLLGRKPTPLIVERAAGDGDDDRRVPTNICIYPGDERLVSHDISGLFPETLKHALVGAVHPISHEPFDVIVLDLPTAPRQLIQFGLRAATSAIHVLDAHLFAVRKTKTLLEQCADWTARGFDVARRHCVVANRVNLSRRRDKELLKLLPGLLEGYQQFIVKQDEGLARATSDGVPVHDQVKGTEAALSLIEIAGWGIELDAGSRA